MQYLLAPEISFRTLFETSPQCQSPPFLSLPLLVLSLLVLHAFVYVVLLSWNINSGWVWWLTPVVPVLQEAEAGRSL